MTVCLFLGKNLPLECSLFALRVTFSRPAAHDIVMHLYEHLCCFAMGFLGALRGQVHCFCTDSAVFHIVSKVQKWIHPSLKWCIWLCLHYSQSFWCKEGKTCIFLNYLTDSKMRCWQQRWHLFLFFTGVRRNCQGLCRWAGKANSTPL